MRKRLFSVALALCMVLFCVPMSVFADPAEVIQIDVGGGNADNENYLIDDSRIILRKRDVTYELTGTTDKNISLWGSNDAVDIDQAFYIRANGVTVNGGIIIQNSPVKMVLNVVGENTISRVSANDLTINGAGTLYATALNVTQKTSYMPSALHITDTNIVVNTAASASDSCEWNGPCVLDGSASVKYISNNDYPALKVGVKSGDNTHALTLKDSAKLYCVQADASNPSASSVNGLELYGGAVLRLQGSSYLEAEGRDSTGEYPGCAIASQKDIIVEDSAKIKATAYDAAISTWGKVTVSGGTIEANSQYSNGIYGNSGVEISNGAQVEAYGGAPAIASGDLISVSGSTVKAISSGSNGIYTNGAIEIKDGANVTAEGYWAALWGTTGLTAANSKVTATSSNDAAMYSPADVKIENSIIQANGDSAGVRAVGDLTVSGSWVESTGDETPDTIANSAYLNGNSGKVTGDLTLPGSVTLPSGKTLEIPENASLTVGEGNTFENNGTVTVNGTVTNNGTVICNNHAGGKATCKDQAVCDLCKTPYGDLDAKNHTDLVKVDAVEATAEHAGNITYWYCSGCGKYFADEQAENEITQADTVLPQLAPEIIEGMNGKWTLGSKDALRFRANAPYVEFKNVSVDGTVIDARSYTISDTVVELTPEFLNTLAVGDHTLTVLSGAGETKTQFTVLAAPATPTPTPTVAPTATPVPTAAPTATPTAAPSATPTAKPTAKPTVKPTAAPTPKADSNNPKTGSSNLPVVIGGAALVLSGGALAAVLVFKKKKQEK